MPETGPLPSTSRPGEAVDCKTYDTLIELPDQKPDALIADKADDTDAIHDDLKKRRIRYPLRSQCSAIVKAAPPLSPPSFRNPPRQLKSAHYAAITWLQPAAAFSSMVGVESLIVKITNGRSS
jgi:hypothetical protein